MSDGLSLEEMSSGKPAAKADAATVGHLTLADMDPGHREPEPPTPGVLANAPDDSDFQTALKGSGTAAIKALSQVPGLFGNIREGANALTAAVPAGWNSLFNNANFKQDYAHQLDAGRAADANMKAAYPAPLRWMDEHLLPSGQDIQQSVFPHTGEYQPSSTAGALAMAGAEGLGGALVPGSAAAKIPGALETAAPKLMPYLANLLSGTSAGVGTAGAAQVTDNPWVQGGTGLVASLLPGAGAKIAAGRTAGTAERLAGQAMRDAVTDPNSVATSFEQIPASPLPGAKLTSAQVSRDPGLAAIETSMTQKTGREGTFGSQVAQDTADSAAAMETGVGKASKQAAKQPWVEANLASGSPEESSVKARDAFTKAEESADKAQSAAWSDSALDGALMHKNKTINRLRETVSEMPVADQEIVGNMYGKILDKIDDAYKNQIPMSEIQSLRSSILADQRSMTTGANPNYNGARVMGKLANAVSDTLSQDRNYFYKPPGFMDAYDAAKKATADYYKTFGPMKDFLASPMAGVDRVAPEATLQKLLRGDNAPQNIRLFRTAVGPSVDEALSDFVVSDMTGHGSKLPTPDQVEKYMTDNAGKIAEIPGLDRRLSSLKTASRSDLVAQGLVAHADNPSKLFDFLDSNKADVNATFSTPQQKEMLAAIKDTAKRLSAIPEGEIGSKETFNDLMNGKTLDVLLGSLAAKGVSTAAGAGAGMAASHFGLPHGAEAAELLGAAGLFSHGTKLDIGSRMAQQMIMGDNQDAVREILQEGLRDPKVGAMLMRKADPDTLNFLFQKVAPNLAGTLPGVAKSAQQSTPYASGGAVERSQSIMRKVRATFPLNEMARQ